MKSINQVEQWTQLSKPQIFSGPNQIQEKTGMDLKIR